MNRSIVIATAVALVAGPAFSADLPIAPRPAVPVHASTWTGLYAGIHGGAGWGNTDVTGLVGNVFPAFFPPAFDQDVDGAVLGGHFGFNYQAGNAVVGLEGSLSWSDIGGSKDLFVFAPPSITDTRLHRLATVTPRLGYASGPWLLYAKGGLALGQVESDLSFPPAPATFNEKEWHAGWTVGVGIEYAWTPNWVLGLEYNYYDLGRQRYGGTMFTPAPVPGGQYDLDLTFSTVLARLSYRWDAAPAASSVMPVKAPAYAAPAGPWSGPYAGIHAGYGWGDADYAFSSPQFLGLLAPATGGSFGQKVDGAAAGIHVGYNWQRGAWMAGVEAAFTLSDIGGLTGAVFSPATPPDVEHETDVRWLATFTPRLGFVTNNALYYVKGGLAAGEVRSTIASNLAAASYSETNTHVGWTIGVGAEWTLAPNWIFGVEYNYYDLGAQEHGGFAPGPALALDYEVDVTLSTLLARLTYRFGS